MPGVELHHGARVVAEVAQQPPQPLSPTHVSVGDDEGPVADARASGGACKRVRVGEWMAAALSRRRGQVGVDVEEACTGDVPGEVELATAARTAELPATVDELVAKTYQLPPGDAGSGTDAGWIT